MPPPGVLQEPCAQCGHSFSFHGKTQGKACRAVGCQGGPDGWTCPGYEIPESASPELLEALSAQA